MVDLERIDELVSFVIPTRKRPDLLARALDSLPTRARVFVVDDGAGDHDGSIDELPQLALSNISVIKNEAPMGASFSRNLGASYVNTDWICFLDDDDCFTREYIRAILSLIRESPEVEAWVADTVGGSQRMTGLVPADDVMARNKVGGCSGLVIKKSLFDRVGGFDADLRSMQDWDLWIRLLENDALYYSGLSGVIYDTGSIEKITHNLDNKYTGLRRLFFCHHSFWSDRARRHHLLRLRALRLLLQPAGTHVFCKLGQAIRSPLILFYFLRWKRYSQ